MLDDKIIISNVNEEIRSFISIGLVVMENIKKVKSKGQTIVVIAHMTVLVRYG